MKNEFVYAKYAKVPLALAHLGYALNKHSLLLY